MKLKNSSLSTKVRRQLLPNRDLYLFVLPAILFFTVFHYLPMYGVQIAFRDFRIGSSFSEGQWVGLKYFQLFFRSGMMAQRVITNTILISAFQLIIGFPLPIVLALLVNQVNNKLFKKAFQTISYAPYFISVVVAVGLLKVFFGKSNGIVNVLRLILGADPVSFMTASGWFRTMFIGSNLWQHIGWGSIIYIAALASVDVEMYEASYIDGASRLQRIVHLEVPALIPTIVILLILSAGNILNVGFEKVLLMQVNTNLSTSEIISTYTYKVGILNVNYSLASAIGLFNSVVNFILLVAVNYVSRRLVQTSLW